MRERNLEISNGFSVAPSRRAALRIAALLAAAHGLPDDALEAARHAPRCEIAAPALCAPAAHSSHPRTHAPDPG